MLGSGPAVPSAGLAPGTPRPPHRTGEGCSEQLGAPACACALVNARVGTCLCACAVHACSPMLIHFTVYVYTHACLGEQGCTCVVRYRGCGVDGTWAPPLPRLWGPGSPSCLPSPFLTFGSTRLWSYRACGALPVLGGHVLPPSHVPPALRAECMTVRKGRERPPCCFEKGERAQWHGGWCRGTRWPWPRVWREKEAAVTSTVGRVRRSASVPLTAPGRSDCRWPDREGWVSMRTDGPSLCRVLPPAPSPPPAPSVPGRTEHQGEHTAPHE